MDLHLPGDEENPRREPLPDFNDERYPQDDPTGTFRGTKIKLSELVTSDDIAWEQLFGDYG